MSRVEMMSEIKNESIIKKYLWLIVFSVSGSLLFSIIGLHYYVDTISEYDYELVLPHIKFADMHSGGIEYVCAVRGLNNTGTVQLGNDPIFDPNAQYVKIPNDVGYCDGYLQTRIHNWWDFLR